MPMPLDQWHEEVSRHLALIEAGADICVRHVEQLPLRPDFRTLAEEELCQCEAALQHALTKVRLAQAIYRDKPVEG
jgi:hypothetical protein